MKQVYEKPSSQLTYLTSADIITTSIDSAEDGFDGDIVDLNPVG